MILAKSAILEALESGDIVINTVAEGVDVKNQISANSVDLSLGRYLKIYDTGTKQWHEHDLIERPLELRPYMLVLGITNEWVYSNKYVPKLFDKSSCGRSFLTSINGGAGLGDLGFGGHYTLEIKADMPVTLKYGMLISQMVFIEAKGQGDYNESGRYSNEFTGEHPRPEPNKGFKNVFDLNPIVNSVWAGKENLYDPSSDRSVGLKDAVWNKAEVRPDKSNITFDLMFVKNK